MNRAKLLIILLLCFAGLQQAVAQSDIELTDSISNEWEGDTGGGGIIPSIPSNPVTSLTLSQTSITIKGGERYKLTAKTNSDAGNKRVIWSIADNSIAFIGSDGAVRGLKTGRTTVTASSFSNPEITASCSVTVTSDYVEPVSGWILPWGKDEAWDMNYLYFEQSQYKEPSLDEKGNNWKELNYDDTAWGTLTGPMGSPGITFSSYNYEWKGEYNCFCLRRTFALPKIGKGSYTFRMQHDDDIVVYLNGTEIINETGWTDGKIKTYTIPSDKFIAGENILAIFIKQNHGGAFLDYSLYYNGVEKPSDNFDIGFLPDVNFEFFYDATLYNEATQSIPNHEAANLAGHNLKLTANLPGFKNGNHLSIENRCEGYIDRWSKGSTESGAYFYRQGSDCMTIVCRVKPKMNTGNASDLISNRGTGYNYMFRVGDHNSFFLHTKTAYNESRAINLKEHDGSQVLAVRVDGANNYIQLDNFTTGESKRISGVNWGGSDNIMKFFYNEQNEYYIGDVYWMYYSKNYVADKDLRGLVSYGLRKSYNLTYIVDGEVYTVEKIEEGTQITPTTPYKEGYTFSGWSGLPKTMPARDVTVTGTFTANTYKITYMVDGEVYTTSNVKYGETITAIEDPTKEGYTFSGWSGLPKTMPARDITVTGSFAINSYNLVYIVDGKEYKKLTIKFGEAITPEAELTKEGYTFSGWSEVPETMPARDITVTGTFTVNTYKITYMVDGEVYTTANVKYGETIIPIEEPTKEGYTFSGWNGLPTTMPTRDITITGTFTVNTYNLIYILDNKEYKRVPVKFEEKIEPEADPTKEGHTFSGWKIKEYEAYPIDIAGNADNMLYSNAYCTMPGDEFIGWHVLFDDDPNTFFHSEWSSANSSDGLEHYLRVDLGEGNEIENFSFTYTNRGNLSEGAPKTMVIEGSNIADGTYTEITTLTDLPGDKADVYESDIIGNGNKYRFIRFRVTETQWNRQYSEHPFFYISEFGMTEQRIGKKLPETMPARDITAIGKFTVNTYKITYMVDGEVYKTVNVKYGET
ncbi:MAG: InlB B-repeat-containing protein, partial [Bacteroidaceae bacterium]|nr:InlB B-repeat-containing protein [Bacteroidaceae bacterium]